MSEVLLDIRGLTKAYPGVVANDNISMSIRRGEIHALLGENGAGKSTLVKMIYGLVKPDSGEMLLEGQPYAPAQPQAARTAGIAMVFQHFSLFDSLNVAQNISLGMAEPPAVSVLSKQILDVSERYGLPLEPNRLVGDLSAGERQRVEIIRCLLQDPKLLVMDEPTSVLTPQEVDTLFETLHKLSDAGTSILYISHKLVEVQSLCETATILRHGLLVDTCDPRETDTRELAERMVGASLHIPEKIETEEGEILLDVDQLSTSTSDPFGTSLKSVTFNVRKREILGIGGVAGNGQDELVAALSGETQPETGRIILENNDLSGTSTNSRRNAGLCSAPEERNGHAAVSDMNLIENAFLSGHQRMALSNKGFVDWSKAANFADEIIDAFDVRTPNSKTAASALSGGNLQKFVVGREILQNPKVLVINQPTWGVDAAAAASIRQALLDLAETGSAIVVISQDLDELIEISDRLAVLNEGVLSEPRATAGMSIDEIGLMLGDASDEESVEHA